MNKYIDADLLRKEIERRIGIKENLSQRPEMSDMKESLQDIIGAYQSLKSFITSLQQEQPEADLEREIIKYKVPFSDDREYLNEQTLDAIARHFYELGLKTRKEG